MNTIWCPELAARSGPRYRAIAAAIAEAIEDGRLAPGERLPTHRALAEALGVTVGTVTRGYAEAERQGLVRARVGSGTYVRGGEADPPEFAIAGDEAASSLIPMGLSLPAPIAREGLLAQALREIAGDRAALADALGYHPEAGIARHREMLAGWLREAWGVPVAADSLLLSLGGMHGVYLALQALLRPGETLASEALTYPGLIAAARQLGLRHVGLAMDDEGLIPEALEAACRQQGVRAVYCMPNQNNPTTAVMSEARRQALLTVARREGVTVIEDDVHLVAANERPPNLLELDPERVVYVTGCSKVLAGGLRVGMVHAPAALLARLAEVLRSHCWMAPPLNAEVACRWIGSGVADELAAAQRDELGGRQALAAEKLAGSGARGQPYGFNLWLPLPEPWRASAFVRRCEAEGLLLRSAEPFTVGSLPAPQAVRLSLSAPASREAVTRGLDIVRRVLAEAPPVQALV
ncbi:aminotransferase-like domain-containing protein [Spiribacter halobius]|uniref:PLP-dependent aminotransferase family protein n=1 Tax=Sediminicurvatus halobius TaxID=2182432 RepID=A0A2U2MZA1_9GAMM|nr:PLP-dependent aminotransferase family protein [Spiribacter halobius]PWG62054.1 PLP-dependent aminotransferase family protein [Spiribacter halobius]UEX78677.1 PLP-dependent aminotransferase family protein [Spiribacter halobius]